MTHFHHHFLEGMEFASSCINIVLINFIGKNEEAFFVGEFNDFLDVFTSEHLACEK
jgi:hypothetical protein